ncbi:MAG: hypothetical protein SGPRY_005923 [Prymnesium sp.]
MAGSSSSNLTEERRASASPRSRALRPTSSRPFWHVQELQLRGRSAPDEENQSTHVTGARRLRRTLSRPFWKSQERRRLARLERSTAATATVSTVNEMGSSGTLRGSNEARVQPTQPAPQLMTSPPHRTPSAQQDTSRGAEETLPQQIRDQSPTAPEPAAPVSSVPSSSARRVQPTSSRPFWGVQEQQRRGRSVGANASSDSTHATGARRIRRTLSRPFWKVQEKRREARSCARAASAKAAMQTATKDPASSGSDSGRTEGDASASSVRSGAPVRRSKAFWEVKEAHHHRATPTSSKDISALADPPALADAHNVTITRLRASRGAPPNTIFTKQVGDYANALQEKEEMKEEARKDVCEAVREELNEEMKEEMKGEAKREAKEEEQAKEQGKQPASTDVKEAPCAPPKSSILASADVCAPGAGACMPPVHGSSTQGEADGRMLHLGATGEPACAEAKEGACEAGAARCASTDLIGAISRANRASSEAFSVVDESTSPPNNMTPNSSAEDLAPALCLHVSNTCTSVSADDLHRATSPLSLPHNSHSDGTLVDRPMSSNGAVEKALSKVQKSFRATSDEKRELTPEELEIANRAVVEAASRVQERFTRAADEKRELTPEELAIAPQHVPRLIHAWEQRSSFCSMSSTSNRGSDYLMDTLTPSHGREA